MPLPARRIARQFARLMAGLAAAAMLAACDPGGSATNGFSFLGGGFLDRSDRIEVVRAVTIAGGEVTVSGPSGFCVERGATRDGRRAGFVMLASCSVLSGGYVAGPGRPAVLTVTVSPDDGPTEVESAVLVEALGDLDPIEARDENGLALVRFEKGGERAIDGALPGHWRGLFDLDGRLVLLAAYGPRGSAVDTARGGDLLRTVAASIRAESAARKERGASPLSETEAAALIRPRPRPGTEVLTAEAMQESDAPVPGDTKGLIGRLFP